MWGILNLKLIYISKYFLYVGQKLLSIPAEVEWKKGRAGSIQTSFNQLCKGLAEGNQCDYQATTQRFLKTHKQSKHEGVKYSCTQCEYQAY